MDVRGARSGISDPIIAPKMVPDAMPFDCIKATLTRCGVEAGGAVQRRPRAYKTKPALGRK